MIVATSILDPFYTFIYKFIVDFLNWAITQIFAPINEQFTFLNEHLPDFNQGTQDYVAPYIAFINLWFPLDMLFMYLFAFVCVFIATLTIKWVMKFVPGF